MPPPPANKSPGWPHLQLTRCFAGVLALGVLLPWFSGCESAPGASQAPAAPAEVATKHNPFDAVQKGMTAAQVRALVGDPPVTKPFKSGGRDSEIWSYQYKVSETTRLVPIGTREVPTINPVTGQPGTSEESVMGHETTTLYQDINMLMIGGRIVEINRKPRMERNIIN